MCDLTNYTTGSRFSDGSWVLVWTVNTSHTIPTKYLCRKLNAQTYDLTMHSFSTLDALTSTEVVALFGLG